MAHAGYSGTPLWKKLGIKSGMTVVTINAPSGYDELLSGLPNGVAFRTEVEEPIAFVHLFVDSIASLQSHLPQLKNILAPDGVIWVSWPKKSSGVKTDMSEDVIRKEALPMGLVDIKVCAVNATWSGLKLVIPVAKRAK